MLDWLIHATGLGVLALVPAWLVLGAGVLWADRRGTALRHLPVLITVAAGVWLLSVVLLAWMA